METKQLLLKIPEDIHKKLKTMAFFNETTMKDIILEMVIEKLEKEGVNQ